MPKRKAKKPRKPTIKQQYEYQLKRLQRGIKRNESKGYVYNEINLPHKEKPTRRDVEKIKAIKPLHLADPTRRIDIETGEIYSARKFKPLEPEVYEPPTPPPPEPPQESAYQRWYNESTPEAVMSYERYASTIVSNQRQRFAGYPKAIANKLLAWLDQLITQQGVEDVAYMFEQGANSEDLNWYLDRAAYDSEAVVQDYCSAMIEYLPNASDYWKQSLMESFDQLEVGYEEGD